MDKKDAKDKAKTKGAKVLHGLKSKDVIDLLEALEGIKLDFEGAGEGYSQALLR